MIFPVLPHLNASSMFLLHIYIVDFDLIDISDWVQDMEPYVQDSVKYLVGNKSDLENIRVFLRLILSITFSSSQIMVF
jgi:hypothetical protein